VVHLVGGLTGFIATFTLGPRLGVFKNSKLDKFIMGRMEIQK
jgi:ammonia channel protein AmtB